MPDSPVMYPLGPASVNGNEVTVDTMMREPTRVNRFLTDYLNANRQRFLLDVIFDNAGGMSGGTIIYEKQGPNDFYTQRDVQQVAPGAAFPLVTFARTIPGVAKPEKWGGQFEVTYEARDRNDTRLVGRYTTQLGNTIIRKLNIKALSVLSAAISSLGGDAVIAGNSWTSVNLGGTNPTAPQDTPAADLAAVLLKNELREMGLDFDTLILHPSDMTNLRVVYGRDLEVMLRDYGFTTVFVTARKTAGSAYAVAGRGQVGAYHVEQPLQTVRKEDELLEKFTVKSSVRPAMYVDNAYGIIEITGIAA